MYRTSTHLRRTSFFLIIFQTQSDIVEIVKLGQTLTIMSKLILILEVERDALGRALSLPSEPLQHPLFRCHGRVVFAEASVDETARTIPFLELLQ